MRRNWVSGGMWTFRCPGDSPPSQNGYGFFVAGGLTVRFSGCLDVMMPR